MPQKDKNQIIKEYLEEKGIPQDRGITFPDVFIVDETSRIRRRSDIRDLGVSLGRGIRLHIPVVSGNMADVTEARMAIAIARLGGCGFIHQFLPIEKRVLEVERVKRADNEVIEDPWQVDVHDSFQSAWSFMKDKNISGVLVVDAKKKGKLVGMLTHRDVRFVAQRFPEKLKLSNFLVKDVMTPAPLVTASPTVKISDAIVLLDKHKIEKLPLVDTEGRPVGLITSKDVLKKLQFPNAARDKKGRLIVGSTVGVSGNFLNEAERLIKAGCDVLLVDTARANSIITKDAVRAIRKRFSTIPIVAGNVDNAEGALLMIEAGADCVKVGIGPGSACKTRTETGVGMPQLSAIAECVAVAKPRGISIIADGGIHDGSTVAKAIVAGADAVLLAGILGGTDETPGEVYRDGNEKYKIYRGSAGLDTQLSRLEEGGLDRVRAPEGVTRKVPYKGQSAIEVVDGLMENLRSAMSYTNAETIAEFQTKRFKFQTHAGYLEGQPKN